MISMREAVQKATEAVQELYPEETLRDLLLEEIEQVQAPNSTWLVTMGFTRPIPRIDRPLQALTLPPSERAYKRIRIDGNNGEFKGMSDRLLDEQLRP